MKLLCAISFVVLAYLAVANESDIDTPRAVRALR